MTNFINNEKDIKDLINKNDTLFLYICADWCNPCKVFMPIYDEVAQEVESKVMLIKAKIEDVSQISNDYSVSSIPTILIFKNGKFEYKVVGSMQKSELLALTDKYSA